MKTFRGVLAILIISVITGFAVNAMSPRGISLIGNWDVSKGAVLAKENSDNLTGDIEIQSADQAFGIYQRNTALFVDARDNDLFKEGHVKGAVSLPVNDYGTLFKDFIQAHPFSQELVVYCAGRECEDSHRLAEDLVQDGYTHVRIFIDGFPAWENKGYPVEKNN